MSTDQPLDRATPEPTLDELLAEVRISFWMCPVPEHERNSSRPTVEWRAGVAYCLTPGCDRTSANTTRADYGFLPGDPDVKRL